jgi:hypothetical protein
MGLVERAKKALKKSKGNASTAPEIPVGKAANPEGPPQKLVESKPDYPEKPLGINVLSPGESPIVE